LLASQAAGLQRAGADIIAMATNTMHKCAPQVIDNITVPFIHIVDALATSLKADYHSQPLLLATRFTMEQSFYRDRLAAQGITVIIPDEPDRLKLHDIIFNELCKGIMTDTSRKFCSDVIKETGRHGADSVILGCTEICMLINATSPALPMYDTTRIHATALVDFALT